MYDPNQYSNQARISLNAVLSLGIMLSTAALELLEGLVGWTVCRALSLSHPTSVSEANSALN